MWIKNTNEHSDRLYLSEYMDESIEFTSNGTANVPEDVGQSLIDNVESIEANDDDEPGETVEETVDPSAGLIDNLSDESVEDDESDDSDDE